MFKLIIPIIPPSVVGHMEYLLNIFQTTNPDLMDDCNNLETRETREEKTVNVGWIYGTT